MCLLLLRPFSRASLRSSMCCCDYFISMIVSCSMQMLRSVVKPSTSFCYHLENFTSVTTSHRFDARWPGPHFINTFEDSHLLRFLQNQANHFSFYLNWYAWRKQINCEFGMSKNEISFPLDTQLEILKNDSSSIIQTERYVFVMHIAPPSFSVCFWLRSKCPLHSDKLTRSRKMFIKPTDGLAPATSIYDNNVLCSFDCWYTLP